MKIPPLLIAVLGVLVLALALWVSQQDYGGDAQPSLEKVAVPPVRNANTRPTFDPVSPPPEAPQAAGLPSAPVGSHEVAELKARVDRMEQTLDSVVDSLNALIDRLNRQELAAQRARQPMYGPDQATGEPDTMNAGDLPTAWASLNPDGGTEWLQLGYETTVEIAQVRVRQTCYPGCITKVTAVSDQGTEVVIWQGRQTAGEGIVEAPFDAPSGIIAQTVKVYLDTKLVPGWNEIDAVELIGHDGSRQWAQSASASSSFGDRAKGGLGGAQSGRSPAGGTLWGFGAVPAGDDRPLNSIPRIRQARDLVELPGGSQR